MYVGANISTINQSQNFNNILHFCVVEHINVADESQSDSTS